MQYSTIIFDLDGTLMDTLADLAASTNYALEQLDFPLRDIEEVRNFVGNGVRKLLERAAPSSATPEQQDLLLTHFRSHYAVHCNDHSAPYDGVIPLLRKLDEMGVKMAIVSNKPDAEVKALNNAHFSEYISVALGENEAAGVPKKPSPEMLRRAMGLLGSPAGDCLYVGDSDVDILTAKYAGVDCLSVTWGFRSAEFLREHGATVCVTKPEEILAYKL